MDDENRQYEIMIQRQKHDSHEDLDAMGDAMSRGHSRADNDNTMVSNAVESTLTEANDASDHATNESDEETTDE